MPTALPSNGDGVVSRFRNPSRNPNPKEITMCDHLCSLCGAEVVDWMSDDLCFWCFLNYEFEEYRHGDTDDPSKD